MTTRSSFLHAWAGAMFMGMLRIGLLVFLFMWPICGFRDPRVMGLIAAVLEANPFTGPRLSAVPTLIFAPGNGGMTPPWVVLANTAIQALENHGLVALITTRGMKLHPEPVLFTMRLSFPAFEVLGLLVTATLVPSRTFCRTSFIESAYRPRSPTTPLIVWLGRFYTKRWLNRTEQAP